MEGQSYLLLIRDEGGPPELQVMKKIGNEKIEKMIKLWKIKKIWKIKMLKYGNIKIL